MIENLIKNLPEHVPSEEFIYSLREKLNSDSSKKNLFQHIFINYLNFGLVVSIMILFTTCIFSYQTIKELNTHYNNFVNVDLKLVSKVGVIANKDNNVFLIYDVSNNLKEVSTSYKVNNGILEFQVMPGIYRIVFASQTFQDLAFTKIVHNNS